MKHKYVIQDEHGNIIKEFGPFTEEENAELEQMAKQSLEQLVVKYYADAVIHVRVPGWQIGQECSVYFKDTMCVKGKCENERPHGKWIRITKNTAPIQMWNCSECGRTVEKDTVLDPDIFFPFCHCGADMREVDNDKRRSN